MLTLYIWGALKSKKSLPYVKIQRLSDVDIQRLSDVEIHDKMINDKTMLWYKCLANMATHMEHNTSQLNSRLSL